MPRRAAKVCTANPDCPYLQPCPVHPPKAWAGSKRRARSSLSGSQQQRRAERILHRYDRVCHVCERPGAEEVDHVIPLSEGGADTDPNCRPIHSVPCHRDKTLAEARRARS